MLPLCWKGKQGICRGRVPEGNLRLDFTTLLVGAALLVLTVPVAQAQSRGAEAMAQPGMEGPGRYLVTFGLDQATLTEQDRRVIAQAAEDYRQGGSPQVSVTGHTDTSGSAAYNLELSWSWTRISPGRARIMRPRTWPACAAFALNVLRANQDQGSTRGKIKRAGWDDAFLLNLLTNA